jgi:hypothetical protein
VYYNNGRRIVTINILAEKKCLHTGRLCEASEIASEHSYIIQKVLAQKKTDSNKIYSLHQSHVQCISKGKEHKKYEFGSKVSIITTKNSGK